MLRSRRFAFAAFMVIAAALACDDHPIMPPTTGGIAIVITSDSAAIGAPASGSRGIEKPDSTGEVRVSGEMLPPGADVYGSPAGIQAFSGVRVNVTGPTTKSTVQTVGTGGFFDVTVTGLAAGNYAVSVEGLIGTAPAYETDFFGSANNILVAAGQTTPAAINNWFTLQAVPVAFGAPSTAMTLPVSWPVVANATGYIIESDRVSTFPSPIKRAVTTTSGTVSATDTGTTYVRVRATNAVVPGGARPGPVQNFRVLREVSDSTDLPAGAKDLGFATAANGSVTALNIAPVGDVDWFAVKACQGDSVIATAKAVRLTPPTSLNSQLEITNPSGTSVATNNDADSTDAEIRYLVATSGKQRIKVSGQNSTTGSYELAITVKTGPRNTGTVCQNNVALTGNANLAALGATSQLAAQLLDSDGNPIAGQTYTWNTTDGSVATVSASGLVTAVANGTATISATASGISNGSLVTVQQVVSQVPVTPGGSTIVTLGGTQALSAEAQDANGHPVSGKTVTWASLNPAVITIDGSGTVTSVTSGQASVSATSDGIPGYGVVTVAAPTGTPVNDWSTSPSPTTNVLHGIWGAADNDVFAVGDQGTITHYDGANWTAQTSGTSQSLSGVWGSSGINAFAVGNGGTILRYNGSNWVTMTSPVTTPLLGVWGAGPQAVFAVGNAGTILRFDGTTWTAMSSGTTEVLRAVWGSSGTNVFAAGTGGVILRYNGTAWSPLTNPTTEDLWGVWGFSASEVYAAGVGGRILKYNGTSWATMTSGSATSLRDIWGTSGADVYAVGDGGAVLRYNGTSWSPATSGTTAQLEGVWGTQFVNSVFSVGSNGAIAHGQRLGVVDIVHVTPASPSLNAIAATQQLVAQALDPASSPLIGRTFTWTSKDPSVVTVNASGLVTAVSNGTAYVRASTAGKADSALFTVQQVIEAVEITPGNATVGIGNSAQLTAAAKDVNNYAVTGTSFTWSTSDQAKAVVDPGGLVTALSGTATITATATNGKAGSADVTASVVPVASVTVAPAGATIPISGTQQLTATMRDAGNTILTGRAVLWSTNDQNIATVDASGLVTGVGTGDATITATSEGKGGTATISVSGSVVTSVVVTPSPSTLTSIGATVQLSAEAQDPAHNSVPGKTFTWVSNSPAIATVNATGLVTAVGPGTVNVVATTDGVSGNGAITVAQDVATVEVVPATGNIAVNTSSQLTAIAKDATSHLIVSPPAANWSTGDPDIATVAPTGPAGVLVGGIAVGATNITANISGHTGSSTITVVAVPVATVDVTPAPTTVAEGLTVQLSAVTKDGSTNVLAGRVVAWSSSSPNATVNATGLVTGIIAGPATITATSEGKTGTSLVTVTARTVNTVVVTPRGATVSVPGGNQQFTADAQDVLAASIPGKLFTWASLNPTIATTDPATGVTSVLANGQVTVSATVDGKTGYGLLTSATGAAAVTLWDAETSNAVNALRGVWGTAANNIFAVGGTAGAATIQRWDGANWAPMTTGATAVLEGVWGTGTNNVFAVGSGGTILNYNGTSWAGMTSNTSAQLNDVWGASPTVVYTVGAAGFISRYTGTSWNTVSAVTAQDLYAIWGTASNDIWAVGNAGTVLRFNGTGWVASTDGAENLRGVWGTGPSDVFTVSASGTIRHWNGASWAASGTAGAALNAIYGSSGSDVYAVGVSGTIVRFDGANWTPMVSGTSSDLFSIWSRSGRVLAVGAAGTVRHGFRGATVLVSPSNPTLVTLETTAQLSAEARDAQNNVIPGRTFTWGSNNNTIATVSASGLVTAHVGGTAVITATTGGLAGSTNAIVAQAPVTIVVNPLTPALNAFGATVQMTGTARDAGNNLIPGATFSWGTSDGAVAAVNGTGLVQAVGNGSATITASAGTASGNTTVSVAQVTASVAVSPAGATTTGATQAFAAQALDANLFPIAGKTLTWSSLNTGLATVNVSGVATPVANGQVSVKASVDGKDGYGVLTIAGGAASPITAWASVASGTGNALEGVWGSSPTDVYASGGSGTIRYWNGSTWATSTNPAANSVSALWGSATNDIFGVGGAAGPNRTVLHYNGTWTAMAGVPAGGQLFGVWGSSPTDIWAVGAAGAIIHYNGTTWTNYTPSPTAQDLAALWGSAANDIWAVGNAGTILHYNGTAWTADLSNPTAQNLNAIWGSSSTNVFAVGAAGTTIRYNGAWSPMTNATGGALQAVWGASATDVYAAGGGVNNLVRFNGTDWVRAGAVSGITLTEIWGVGNNAVAVGSAGNILFGYRGATFTVSPTTQTLASLGQTVTIVPSVNGGAVTGVPVTFTSSDPLVATVDPVSGLVTAIGRGAVTITATAAGGATATSAVTVTAIRVARLFATSPGGSAANTAFSSGDLVGTITTLPSAAAFNALTPAQLRAAYDVLLFPFSTDLATDATWTGRLLTYMTLGGGIVTEDANNIGATEFGAVATSPGGITLPCNTFGCEILANVPGLTGAPGATITGNFNNYSANEYSLWDAALTPLIGKTGSGANPPVTGLYGRFGTGCILFSGPVNDYNGVRGSADPVQANMYNLLLNALKWTADCPLTAVAGPPASVVIGPGGATLTTYNQTRQFTATVSDAIGNAIASPTITWQSSDPSILSITTSGLVRAIAGNGNVNVTATVTGGTNPSAVVPVVVNQTTATLVVSPLGATVASGTQQFTAVARNTHGDILTNKVFSWATGTTAVASVNSSGLATAANSGQTPVSATVDGLVASGLLTVNAAAATPVNVWSSQGTPGYMRAMWTGAANNILAVGDGSALLRYNGASWSALAGSGTLVTGQTLYGVWGSSPTNVFAVGTTGALLRYNGSTWSVMPQSGASTPVGGVALTTNPLYRVWGSSANDVWAVGPNGTIIRFNGSTWSAVTHPFGAIYLAGVWGSSANDVYVVGQNGLIGHYDGANWTSIAHGQGSGFYLYGVWGSGTDNVYAVGDAGRILHCTGGSCAAGTGWSTETAPGGSYFWNVWGTSATEVYASGGNGLFRYNGSGSFTAMTVPGGANIWAMSGDQSGSLWAGGGATGTSILRGVRGAAGTTWGNAADLGSNIAWSGDVMLANAISIASKTDISNLGIITNAASATRQVRLALYTDVAGNPGSLVVQGSAAVPAAGVTEIPVPQTQVGAGTYWIVAQYNEVTDTRATAASSTPLKYYFTAFSGGMVSPFPAPSTGTYPASNWYVRGFVVP